MSIQFYIHATVFQIKVSNIKQTAASLNSDGDLKASNDCSKVEENYTCFFKLKNKS